MNKFLDSVKDAWDTYCFLMHSLIEDYSFFGVLLGSVLTAIIVAVITLTFSLVLAIAVCCPSIIIGLIIICVFVCFASNCHERTVEKLKNDVRNSKIKLTTRTNTIIKKK